MALAHGAGASTPAMEHLEILHQRLREALYAKKTRLRELAELCTAQRAELRGWIQQRRAQALAELRAELRRARSAAQANRRARLQDARRSSKSAVDAARAAVAIERAHAADQLSITRAHDAQRVAIDKAHARSLSDDQMSASMLKRLAPLLDKARGIRPAPGESRTEALWRYARAHPEEMHALLEPEAERKIARARKEIAVAEEALRTTGDRVPIKRAPQPPRPESKRAPQPVRRPTRAAPSLSRLNETRSAPLVVAEPAEAAAPAPVRPAAPTPAKLPPAPPPPRPARSRAQRSPRPQLGLTFSALPVASVGLGGVVLAPASEPARARAVTPQAHAKPAPASLETPRDNARAGINIAPRMEVPGSSVQATSIVEQTNADAAPTAGPRDASAERPHQPARIVDDPEKPISARPSEAIADVPVERDSRATGSAPAKAAPLATLSASYDPGDNKLRLRSVHRLDSETYARVKAAGFAWAPKQDLFVAPAWTPQREDLLLELCGEIDDEDTSLVERAEERADRFEEYKEKRADEAVRARDAVAAIADHIPLGQPILVGHHSERRARKDAEKITAGMRKAVNLWKTSNYWQRRAAGAVRHAKYKEDPGVRHRRIKGLEADRRKQLKTRDESMVFLRGWKKEGLTREGAMRLANYDHTHLWSELDREKITVEEAIARATAHHEAIIARADRWIEHLDHRLAYERAMLEEAGGLAAAKWDLQVGGQILERSGWAVILRLNRKEGAIVSVTVAGRWGKAVRGIEEISDYRPPKAGDAEKVAKATKLPPIVNYPGAGFQHVTQAEWNKLYRSSDFSRPRVVAATETHGAHRVRMAPKEGRPYYDTRGVYLTDAKRVDPPAPTPRPELPARALHVPPMRAPRPSAPESTAFDAMAKSLKAGVQVVSADQLFPTPPELAGRIASLANIQPGQRVLEPSAGTGRLLRAALTTPGVHVVAVEIREDLVRALAPKPGDESYSVRRGDFLSLGPSDLGTFEAVIMNPPFADGADVKHILHARTLLKPGGVLVAVCANGSRQREALRPLAATWEELPEGTFKSSGTNVRTALLTMRAPS